MCSVSRRSLLRSHCNRELARWAAAIEALALAEAEAALPPGSRVLPYALGDGNSATLHITLFRGCSSLFEPNEEVIDMFEAISATTEGGNFRVVSKKKISTRRLDEIEECPQADFIKLDVQGAELLVLENALQ